MTDRWSLTRGWMLAATLLALLCRIAVPQTMMLAPVAGQIDIVICTGHGAVTMTLDPGRGDHAPMPSDDGGCAFASAHAATAMAAPPAMVAVAFAAVVAFGTITPALAIGRGLAAPPPPSTGPPALA